ncbi:MAG: lysophospholipid acyltransferase family protein [Bacteroidales bacterium]
MSKKPITKVINISDIKKATKIKGPIGTILASFIMRTLGFCKLNTHYSNFSEYKGREFTKGLLEEFNIRYDIIAKQLDNIPQEGPFIITSNHPFGGIDGIILFHIITSLRPDFKMLSNFILSKIPNLKDNFLLVNPFTNRKNLKSSLAGIRAAKEYVMNGHALGLFPSGEVSTYYKGHNFCYDKEWQPTIIKLIKILNVPVIPVYFHGENSKKFHRLGKIRPILRTLRLPNELNNKCNQTISMRIGKAVTTNEINEFNDIKLLGQYLKDRTYCLEPNLIPSSSRKGKRTNLPPIVLPQNKKLIVNELAKIKKEDLLFEVSNFECFLTSSDKIPTTMWELGRKREESFRAAGEGSGKQIDLDVYDNYYYHLILWDKKRRNLVGAYRLGFGEDIINHYGLDGFYSSTLFNYSNKIKNQMSKSVELGRSFINIKYQKDTLALMLLLKGLLYSLVKYPKYNYIFGPVSISSDYPTFYQSMIQFYLNKIASTDKYKKLIKAKNPFVPDFQRVNIESLTRLKMGSVERFDRYMMRISDQSYRLPTLIKKYIKLKANFVAYNVDKDFNNCVDGLIIVKCTDVPKAELLSLCKRSNPEVIDTILNRFGYTNKEETSEVNHSS